METIIYNTGNTNLSILSQPPSVNFISITQKPVLGIGIDGVLRDIHTQFYKSYKKAFIKNESLVNMDDNYNYVPENETNIEEEISRLEKLEEEKIKTPLNTFNLLNHFHFNSQDDYERFYFTDYAFEIFGTAPQFQRSMDYANRLQDFGKYNNLFDVVLLSKENDKAIAATYHFLSKSGCKIKKVIFVENYLDKWKHCDVLIDDCPEIFENKPSDKTVIKINREYNVGYKVDHEFDSINDLYKPEFLVKIFNKKDVIADLTKS